MSRASGVTVTPGDWPAEAVVGEWDALARRTSAPHYLRPGWFGPWYEAFSPESALVLQARRAEELVGVLPLVERRGVVASASNGHSPCFAPLAADPETLEALLAAARERARRRLDLLYVDGEDPARQQLVAPGGGRTIERVIARSPYIDLEGDWAAFEAALPSKRRSDMRRRHRKLEEAGTVEIADVTESDRIGELLAEGWSVEAKGWKGEGGTAVAAGAATSLFYERIAAWAMAEGLLRLSFLRLDGRVLAFAFCFEDSRTLDVLKIGFDPEYGKFAPGVLLTRHMVETAFDAGLEAYEFLGDADPYKLVWTDLTHERLRIQAFPASVIGRAEATAWRRGLPLAKRLLRRRGARRPR